MARTLAAGLLGLAFLALAMGGWDSWFAASLFAIFPLISVAALSMTPSGRDAIWAPHFPTTAAILFSLSVMVVIIQIIPLPAGWAHPAWGLLGDFSFAAPSMDVHATRVEVGKLLGLGATFLVGVAAGRDPRNVSWLIQSTLIIGGLGYSLWFLGDRAFLIAQGSTNDIRLAGGLGSANVAATILGCILLFGIANLTRLAKGTGHTGFVTPFQANTKGAGFTWISIAVAMVALILTASRGGILSVGAGTIVFLALEFFGKKRIQSDRQSASSIPWRSIGLAAGFVVLSLTITAFFGERLLGRFEVDTLSGSGRAELLTAHWDAFLQLPWLGHGLGTFASINNVYMTRDTMDVLNTAGATHNIYLQWLEETGLLGALPMFGCIGILLADVARSVSKRRRNLTWLRLAISLAVLIGAHSLVDFTLNVYAAAILATLFLGLFWSLAKP